MIAVVKYAYDISTRSGGAASDNVEITRRTATTLRIISRVAMGLRVARVLVNLRKVPPHRLSRPGFRPAPPPRMSARAHRRMCWRTAHVCCPRHALTLALCR